MEYAIGNKTYEQRPLTPGQAVALWEIFDGNKDLLANLDPTSIVKALGENLYKAVAIVLREKGVERWWEKDLDAMADLIKWEMTIEVGAAIIVDFISCNPLDALIGQLTRMPGVIRSVTKSIAKHAAQNLPQS